MRERVCRGQSESGQAYVRRFSESVSGISDIRTKPACANERMGVEVSLGRRMPAGSVRAPVRFQTYGQIAVGAEEPKGVPRGNTQRSTNSDCTTADYGTLIENSAGSFGGR